MPTLIVTLTSGDQETHEVVNGKIPRDAFRSRKDILSVSIPRGVTTIGEEAFSSCTSLVSVTLLDGVTTIGAYAFCACTSLVSVTFPNGVTTIGVYAFCWCASLVSVTLPEGVTKIEPCAFGDCRSLVSVTLPEGVTKIDKNAFFHKTTVLVLMSWSLENFKKCDKDSRERVLTILLCLRRKGIPYVVLRRFLNFLDLTKVLEI